MSTIMKRTLFVASIFCFSYLFPALGVSEEHQNARKYYEEMTSQEKADINFIIMTLATKSQIALLFEKNALHQAGSRLTQVHPLKFIAFIFSNPQLKKAVPRIGSFAWNQFAKDMGDNLAKEAARNNIKEEYIADFVKTVGIQESLISKSVQNGRWVDFINTLHEWDAKQR